MFWELWKVFISSFHRRRTGTETPRPVSVDLGRCSVLLPYVQYLMNSCIWFLQLLHSHKKEEGFEGEEQLLCTVLPVPTPVVFLKAKSPNFINSYNTFPIMQANKYDFPSQTPGQLFIHSLNFLMLRQLLGKWEGRGKRNREYKSIRGGPWSAHTKVCNEIPVSRCCW